MKSIYKRNDYEQYWAELEKMTDENTTLNYLVNVAVANYVAEQKGEKNE